MAPKRLPRYTAGVTREQIEATRPSIKGIKQLRFLFHPPGCTRCSTGDLFFSQTDKLKRHLQSQHKDWQLPSGYSWQRFSKYADELSFFRIGCTGLDRLCFIGLRIACAPFDIPADGTPDPQTS